MPKYESLVIRKHKEAFEDGMREVRRSLHDRANMIPPPHDAYYAAEASEIIIEGMRYNDKLIIADAEGRHVDIGAAASGLVSAIATIVSDFVKVHQMGKGTEQERKVRAAEEILNTALLGVKDMVLGTNSTGVTVVIAEGKTKEQRGG